MLITSMVLESLNHAADKKMFCYEKLAKFSVSFNTRIAKSVRLETNQFFARFIILKNLILNESL